MGVVLMCREKGEIDPGTGFYERGGDGRCITSDPLPGCSGR